jgi:hypothetical protein
MKAKVVLLGSKQCCNHYMYGLGMCQFPSYVCGMSFLFCILAINKILRATLIFHDQSQ